MQAVILISTWRDTENLIWISVEDSLGYAEWGSLFGIKP